jgi:hypothetical protein
MGTEPIRARRSAVRRSRQDPVPEFIRPNETHSRLPVDKAAMNLVADLGIRKAAFHIDERIRWSAPVPELITGGFHR